MSEDSRTELAWQRTAWALERTQLSWVRTSFAIGTAGLALDKGSAALYQAKLLDGAGWVEGGHYVGVAMNLLAAIQLAFATLRYCQREQSLAVSYGYRPPRVPAALPISLIVVFTGFIVAGVLLIAG
ncbi:MAG: DUF202 domain-containing protein [Gemmataceae bacterium]|nr:DUF202 domain-containing protein [Gemmataceae bacterium]